MELRNLRYFVAAAEEENLHRAAARLHITQPALSRRILDLESELGLQLFERARKRIRLTEAGRAYLQDARQVLDALAIAGARANRIAQGVEGTIRIGFQQAAARNRILSRSFRIFSTTYSHVDRQLRPMTSQAQIEAILSREIDAGFLINRPADRQELEWLPIAVDDWLLAMPTFHRLAERSDIRLADLREEDFVWFPRDDSAVMYDRLLSACLAGGLTPQIVQYATLASTQLILVAVGMGVTFIGSSIVGSTPPDIVLRPVLDFSVPVNVDLVWRRDSTSLPLQRFVQVVKDLQAEIARTSGAG